MSETWKPTTSGAHHVRNVRRVGTGWRGEVCLRPGGPRRGEPEDWQTEMWYSDGRYYVSGPKSVLDLVAINEGAVMSDTLEDLKKEIERIETALDRVKIEVDAVREAIALKDAEIERLSDLAEELQQSCDYLNKGQS